MFALGAKTQENEVSNQHMDIAAGLTNTCHESYERSPTKLGPEAFHFIEGNEARSLKNGEKYYILRPEVSSSGELSLAAYIPLFFLRARGILIKRGSRPKTTMYTLSHI